MAVARLVRSTISTTPTVRWKGMTSAERIVSSSLLIIGMVFAMGCTTYYTHPSKGNQEWAADYAVCEAQGGQAGGAYDEYGIVKQRVTHNCLVGKGWRKK